jgi:hypothetical protein
MERYFFNFIFFKICSKQILRRYATITIMASIKYSQLCNTPSDINEHLPCLKEYASKCESVFETGVRGCVSSWAFVDISLYLYQKI